MTETIEFHESYFDQTDQERIRSRAALTFANLQQDAIDFIKLVVQRERATRAFTEFTGLHVPSLNGDAPKSPKPPTQFVSRDDYVTWEMRQSAFNEHRRKLVQRIDQIAIEMDEKAAALEKSMTRNIWYHFGMYAVALVEHTGDRRPLLQVRAWDSDLPDLSNSDTAPKQHDYLTAIMRVHGIR